MPVFLSGLLTLSVLLVVAPRFTLTVGGVFGGLCVGLWLIAYTLAVLLQ